MQRPELSLILNQVENAHAYGRRETLNTPKEPKARHRQKPPDGRSVSTVDLKRSPLRWAGSKQKLLPLLREHVPENYNRYVEPFCGSLALFVAIKPESALVGDLNEELINFYKMVRWRPRHVHRLTMSLTENGADYYNIRQLDPSSLAADLRAARFLYLNRHCFNGVYRTNRRGFFNVPRGKHVGSLPDSEELIAFSKLIRNAEIKAGDFAELLTQVRADDFVYLDPPYAGRGVRDRGEYGPSSFRADDIDRLYDAVTQASDKGAKILLSYADLPIIRSRFSSWDITTIEVARNVSGFAKDRGTARELLLKNYD